MDIFISKSDRWRILRFYPKAVCDARLGQNRSSAGMKRGGADEYSRYSEDGGRFAGGCIALF
jgi:hypothetical protein